MTFFKSYTYSNLDNKLGSKYYTIKFNKRYRLLDLKLQSKVLYEFNNKTNVLRIYIKNLKPGESTGLKFVVQRKMGRDIKTYKKINLFVKTFINTRKTKKITLKKKFVYKNFNKSKTSRTINTKLGSSKLYFVKVSGYANYIFNESKNNLNFLIKKLQY
ncbi:hypothetical protein ALNOE001_00120 [Candidatus Methanobinarius endosymbioticus]|uniref:Uncharacterized protein n=1 Tax=Candidatus Methanobinarius endosymbioticus TaxID=2006182 RepID=A0A366MGK0_9EURY|nr:hypothetical protein ALNOE001_00120 [Candidatus Methanobinarius endosymbioticus]